MQNIKLIGILGEGSYGKVWKCRCKSSGRLVAVKEYKGSGDPTLRDNSIKRELLPLMTLSHDNVMKAFRGFIQRQQLYGVFELLMSAGGLDGVVLRKYSYQILRGVHFLHSRNILHRDIKPDNLLVSKSGVVKVADLGSSRKVDGTQAVHLTLRVGTLHYLSPEILLRDREYSKPRDVWAVGCTILAMAKGKMFFESRSELDLVWEIVSKIGPLTQRQQNQFQNKGVTDQLPVPQHLSDPTEKYQMPDRQLAELIEACLQMDPAERANCFQLLNHGYFTWDQFNHSFLIELKEMVCRDRNGYNGHGWWRKFQPQCITASQNPHSSLSFTNSPHISMADSIGEEEPPSIQCLEVSNGTENLEGQRDGEREESEANEEWPVEEVKRKRGFRAAIRRTLNAIRCHFTSRVSPM